MIPLQFGMSTHMLFGLYEPPESGSRNRGVVICNPWGQEYLRAYGAIRFLAKRLRLSGYHVLRFDYYGCGDSGGEFTDADVECWQHDTDTAVEELKATAGASTVTLVGARFGAVMASQVAARRTDIDRLVLWDPITDSSAYLAELVRSSRLAGAEVPVGWPHADRDLIVDLEGSPVTRSMARSIVNSRIDNAALQAVRSTLLVTTPERLHDYSPATSANNHSVDFTALAYSGPDVWRVADEFGSAGIPLEAIEAVVTWLK